MILLVNPMAVFGAGFQLSFAATTGLVIWFEAWRHRAGQNNAGQDHAGQGAGPRPRVLRWAGDLILASLIASAATTPLTAQHFGTVTPWGVLANLIGIPLTGIWIMPSGLLVLATQFLPVPAVVQAAALSLMGAGIDLLVGTAGFLLTCRLRRSMSRRPVCRYLPPLVSPDWCCCAGDGPLWWRSAGQRG